MKTLTTFLNAREIQISKNKSGNKAVIDLLDTKVFGHALLLSTSENGQVVKESMVLLQKKYPKIRFSRITIRSRETDNVSEIIAGILEALVKHLADHPETRFYFNLASGPNRIRAALLSLQMTDAIGAQLLESEDSELMSASLINIKQIAQYWRFFGSSPEYQKLLTTISIVARNTGPVLITGPRGTEKEAVAHLIYSLSKSSGEGIRYLNCELLHSTNHDIHAYLDTVTNYRTLILENVEHLSKNEQEHVLSYFSELRRDENIPCKLIIMSDHTLEQLINNSFVSPGLLQSLKDQIIYIPPLEHRIEDIPVIANNILKVLCQLHDKEVNFEEEARNYLTKHSWPQNFEELYKTIERCVLLTHTNTITKETLEQQIMLLGPQHTFENIFTSNKDFSLPDYLNKQRQEFINKALEHSKGNQSEAARILKITPQAVHQYIKQYKSLARPAVKR